MPHHTPSSKTPRPINWLYQTITNYDLCLAIVAISRRKIIGIHNSKIQCVRFFLQGRRAQHDHGNPGFQLPFLQLHQSSYPCIIKCHVMHSRLRLIRVLVKRRINHVSQFIIFVIPTDFLKLFKTQITCSLRQCPLRTNSQPNRILRECRIFAIKRIITLYSIVKGRIILSIQYKLDTMPLFRKTR